MFLLVTMVLSSLLQAPCTGAKARSVVFPLSVIEGSLEVKLPTIWTIGKTEVGRVREEKRSSEKIRAEKNEKKEEAGTRKGKEVAIHCVFPMICGSGWLKSRLAKAAGAEPAGHMKDEKIAHRCSAKHICKQKN